MPDQTIIEAEAQEIAENQAENPAREFDPAVDDFDEFYFPRPGETDFAALAGREISRRGFMRGTAAAAAAAFVASTAPARAAAPAAPASGDRFGFKPVAANTLDTVTVPEGYGWHVVARWGDPLWSRGAEFDDATKGTVESQEMAFGDNNDGMELFTVDGRSILAVNNEYVNDKLFFAAGKVAGPDDVRKAKAAHGVSVFEVEQTGGKWRIVKDSEYNRKFTADTPMEITGPARGHDLMKTRLDPAGATAAGTWNNCGSGRTPWGTYLTCEENFNGYFSSGDPGYRRSDELKRYGVNLKDWGYAWASADERFDISKHPNEPNRFGYIVEIDPLDPASTPKKRTALGRFKHENAEVTLAADGRVVVYLGDDERGEFLYKFVSDGRYAEGGDNGDLLENGKLYAAKFGNAGRGEWLELNPRTTGMTSRAEIAIHTRQAASAVKATTMDRPEWVAVNPLRTEAYCCLTNNKNRGRKPNAGGDAAPVGGPNPREANNYGQIVRWVPDGGDHLSGTFAWDLYVVAGNPAVHSDANAGSGNVDKDNMFNSPDGLRIDTRGMLWIQTDGNYSNAKGFAGMGNNQMLVGDPATGEIKRFMVGPRQCEITGLTWSADRRTMFVGIQHPGERGPGNSHFPDGGDTTPRSAVVAVTRDDGGLMG